MNLGGGGDTKSVYSTTFSENCLWNSQPLSRYMLWCSGTSQLSYLWFQPKVETWHPFWHDFQPPGRSWGLRVLILCQASRLFVGAQANTPQETRYLYIMYRVEGTWVSTSHLNLRGCSWQITHLLSIPHTSPLPLRLKSRLFHSVKPSSVTHLRLAHCHSPLLPWWNLFKISAYNPWVQALLSGEPRLRQIICHPS